MQKPLIGLTLDYLDAIPSEGRAPRYFLLRPYADVIERLGGLPVALPYGAEAAAYLPHLQGIVITGGACDVPPAYYGETTTHPSMSLKENRSAFELNLAKAALAHNIPILGICGGHQLLAVALGGTLIQDINDQVPGSIEHLQSRPRKFPCHAIHVQSKTRLSALAQGRETLYVNSVHHQAVKTVGAGTVINAMAPDGIIEGFEHPDYRFCMGVQWHAEYGSSEVDDPLIQAFIDAARTTP